MEKSRYAGRTEAAQVHRQLEIVLANYDSYKGKKPKKTKANTKDGAAAEAPGTSAATLEERQKLAAEYHKASATIKVLVCVCPKP